MATSFGPVCVGFGVTPQDSATSVVRVKSLDSHMWLGSAVIWAQTYIHNLGRKKTQHTHKKACTYLVNFGFFRLPFFRLSTLPLISASASASAGAPALLLCGLFFQLAAKEAYLQAKAELADEDRRRILAEFRTLIQEAATTAAEAATEKVASKAAAAAALEAAESAVTSAATGETPSGGVER